MNFSLCLIIVHSLISCKAQGSTYVDYTMEFHYTMVALEYPSKQVHYFEGKIIDVQNEYLAEDGYTTIWKDTEIDVTKDINVIINKTIVDTIFIKPLDLSNSNIDQVLQ
jgi:hypothetical protein